MDALMTTVEDRLVALHESMARALQDLPSEALDWVPGEDMNSLAVLAAHTAGSQRYWIGDVAGQEPSDRVRGDEFRTADVSASELQALLDAALAHSRTVLARLRSDELDESRESPMHDRPFTVGWALMHALEHTAVHTGHMELTRQLWDQRGSVEQ